MIDKIVFVCTANTCRSPMAEYMFGAYLKSRRGADDIEVTSCGLSADGISTIAANTKEVLTMRGINSSAHVSKRYFVDKSRSTLFVCMTRGHKDRMELLAKSMLGSIDNVVTMGEIATDDVDDPYGGSLADYQKIERQIQNALPLIYDYVMGKRKSKGRRKSKDV